MADKPPPSPEDTAASRAKAMVAVQSIFDRWNLLAQDKDTSCFDTYVMTKGKVLDASLGPPPSIKSGSEGGLPSPAVLASSTCSLVVEQQFGNVNGVMHGGAYGVIFDMMTTIALGPLSRPGFWDFLGGVTRTLNISYLRPCPLGSTVLVHAHVYHVGRSMALIKGWMTSEDGKVVYATCDHHKVAVPTPEEHLTYRVAWDEQWDAESAPPRKSKSSKM